MGTHLDPLPFSFGTAIPDSRLELLDAGHGLWLGHPDTVAQLVEEFVTA
ncbi:MAG: glycoside hydrolase family 6 protein [Actinobacteria bacterium]|nr:glycoside hydrolase family 6 protein [Actinomycetota bacterium]